MNKKNKIIICIFISVLIIALLTLISTYFLEKYRINQIEFMNDEICIEYGEQYNIEIEKLFDLDKYNYIKIDNVEIIFDIENELGKEYLAVGEYMIKIIYSNMHITREFNKKLIVQDTTIPELIISQENIEITAGNNLSEDDIKSLLSAYDLAELKDYEIDFSNVDANVPGEYFVKISVEDVNGNKAEKELLIIVKEKPKPIVQNNQKPPTKSDQESQTQNNQDSNNVVITPPPFEEMHKKVTEDFIRDTGSPKSLY